MEGVQGSWISQQKLELCCGHLLFDNEYPHRCHANESDKIPAEWCILVFPHQSIMNIFLADDIVHMGITPLKKPPIFDGTSSNAIQPRNSFIRRFCFSFDLFQRPCPLSPYIFPMPAGRVRQERGECRKL